ncbi:MAG TPA: AAA family ATPase, partial [Pirellulales bacterium]|nr:AAA family ATPase [Pirellulales bacterium]
LESECDYRGIGSAGRQICERCLAAIGDRPPTELQAFYRCYRASVRAKVAMLRSRQLSGADRDRLMAEAAERLSWAVQYAGEMGRLSIPWLIVVHGLMGSGKSTLAAALADRLGASHIQTDEIRREMFGTSDRPASYNAGLYRPEPRQAVYSRMLEIASQQLGERTSAVLDGTFLKQSQRREAAALAAHHDARFLAVHCVCPPEVALARIAQRAAGGRGASEARPDLYARQQADEEPFDGDAETIEVDTTQSLDDQIPAVLGKLRQLAAQS